MKLTKINYGSAVFFGVVAAVTVLVIGLLAVALPQFAAAMGLQSALPLLGVLFASLMQGLSVYAFILFSIVVYNLVAKKFPVSWEVAKK